MNISQASRRSGLSTKTIRYYEEINLISQAQRGANGYRQYDARAVRELVFLSRSREVGFNLEESGQLLALLRDSGRHSAHAKSLVLDKAQQLQTRIDQLVSMQDVLRTMANRCNGDEGPDCAILDDLAGLEGHDE
ncbi:UNVERIFIED_CONTAM: hypothetical protein GTU68_034952 [Idotea baltica]|nr:hypothetical protein [Idotea baltica]